MLSLIAAQILVLSGQLIEIERNSKFLELNLRVVEAFEHGPVILEVSITNRSTSPLFMEELWPGRWCFVGWPPDWQLSHRVERWCHVVRFGLPLEVGRTHTERFVVHGEFQGAFTAGNHRVMVEWKLRSIQKGHRPDGRPFEVPGRLFAWPLKSFPMIVETATEKNRKALALRLEAEFAALPADTGRDKEDGSAFRQLCDKVIFAPHKELIPLALKLLDRCPNGSRIGDSTYRSAEELVETVFEADARTAHSLFVDRLLADSIHEHSFIAFSKWRKPGSDLCMYLDGVLVRNHIAADWVIRKPWLWVNTLKGMFGWFSTSAPKVLPDEELARLLLAKDLRVRTHISDCFRHRLDRDGKLIGVPK